MDIHDIFKGKSEAGFLLGSGNKAPVLSNEQRIALIRKGNELFNKGDVATAERIYITSGYGDGLIRMGDYYYKKRRPMNAFRMYWLAKDKSRSDKLIEKMAAVIQAWLSSDVEGQNQDYGPQNGKTGNA